MRILKNSFGVGISLSSKFSNYEMIDKMTGSSLDRPKTIKKEKKTVAEVLNAPEIHLKEDGEPNLRSMSNRTKSKIRKKIIAFSGLYKNLSFLTLTFVNKVADKQAVKILANFLENVMKLSNDFQYLWVAEKQTSNKIFVVNIHFHIITNKYWKIDKWWKYWLALQAKHNIIPRDENYIPSSAFDVKHINSNNIKGVVNYLTKYITKNTGQFECQVWNCSKKISRLYTDFFTEVEFLEEFKRLENAGLLGGEIKIFPKEFYTIHLIPLNRTTSNFYNRLDVKNKSIWKEE